MPNSFQVRLAQEDLWVYEALLRIIRATNEGATSYHNAAIKRIEGLHIGTAGSAAFATSKQFLAFGGTAVVFVQVARNYRGGAEARVAQQRSNANRFPGS